MTERTATDRQRLHEALREGPLSAHELSAAAGIPERDVAKHLEHLERSLRHAGERLRFEPPRCASCGFAFPERRRFGRPSRCPKCRSEHVRSPRFWLEG